MDFSIYCSQQFWCFNTIVAIYGITGSRKSSFLFKLEDLDTRVSYIAATHARQLAIPSSSAVRHSPEENGYDMERVGLANTAQSA